VRAAGVVLAGGQSLRMGTSKAWLDWHGTTLLAHVAGIVGRAVEGGPLVVVSAAGQQLPALPPRAIVVEDAREGLGPLQGIATGLAALEGVAEVAFVSSTDAALLHPRFVQRVLDGVDPDVDAVVPHARGHRQPLAAAYRVGLASRIDALLEKGRAKPAFLFERSRTRFVDDAWLLDDRALAAADPALASLENLNDPAAYAAALALPAPRVTVAGEASGCRAFTLGELASSLGVDMATTVRVNGGDVAGDPAFPLAAGDAITFRD
jgi:molybdopterin-guanine dinucleotide biosynthesis protein A